ncbi:MAG: hypothetical protein M1826_001096 [Phylliscum demangeonii]|nr:MAG: hypothetical protein M1826_001096 [Phylliscum demangeonii]
MSQLLAPPYAQQDVQAVARLLQSLEEQSKKKGAKKTVTCRKTDYAIPGSKQQTVQSWRFQDWDYKKHDLPTQARGLFTLRSATGTAEIVVRGYDKFFNVGEVRNTAWESVEKDTRGPYELTLKENGCIIFIAGLPDGGLLVCSKHATGALEGHSVSHALAGEAWVDRQLAAVGKTRAELARELRQRNVTAVAELCDDDFEEHILPYDKDRAGLYLHGVNLNVPEFATYPGAAVHEFADAWGFKKIEYLVEDDVASVRNFLEAVGETGAWHGRDVEGFVIRCQSRAGGSAGAYHDWFFKYKYEEPYLLYRQWREVTKTMISGKTPRFQKHKKITEEYLQYARRRLAQDPALGKAFNQNHGIIAMRQGFLAEKGVRGHEAARDGDGHDDRAQVSMDVVRDVVLVPIATIGCGKTTVSVALVQLFGWSHVQNDNIQGKGRPERFAQQVCAAMSRSVVTLADRNNHQKRERKQLMADVRRTMPHARFVALYYAHERDDYPRHEYHDAIRATTRERVLSRGDNHQTIHAGSRSEGQIVGIMEGFLGRFEAVNVHEEPDSIFDAVIELDVPAPSRENLEKVIAALQQRYPKLVPTMPSGPEMDAALDVALHQYQVEVQHDVGRSAASSSSKRKPQGAKPHPSDRPLQAAKPPHRPIMSIDYFCVSLPTAAVLHALELVFAEQDATTARFYRLLQQGRRVQPTFHVTLIHRAAAATAPDIWQRYTALHASATAAPPRPGGTWVPIDVSLGTCPVQFERVVWDQRVMCIVVRLPEAQEKGFACVNATAHVTVGTASATIKPKESNDLLAAWSVKGSGGESGIRELPFEDTVVLDGTVRAVGR